MKIILVITDPEINKIAGENSTTFIISEFRRDPAFFVRLADVGIVVDQKQSIAVFR